MIQVTGAEGTAEYQAALALHNLITQTWPQVARDPNCHIHLIVSAKCHGQATRDIDVLLLAWFGGGYAYSPFWSFDDAHGQPQRPASVQVHSLCTVIEVKDHSPQGVRFVGTSAQVRYHGAWHDASEQNERQVFALKNYIEYHGLHSPWITRLIWLRNVSNADLPARPHPIVGALATWELLLNIVGQVTPPRRRDGDWVISAFDDAAMFKRVADLFTQVIEPTRLDRLRMERVNRRSADLAPIFHDIGSKMIILRGRGGVGKTMHLLQAAKQLYDEQGVRVLLLTYNKALVADIRRLLTILSIADDIDSSAIHIQTVHSFMYAVLEDLGVVSPNCHDFLQKYDEYKQEAISYFRSGLVTPQDIAERAVSGHDAFGWDYVFIDEGQDWPSDERELLLNLFPVARVMIADGIDQLIRSATLMDWRAGLKRTETQVIPLKRCLRMKAGLARFVTAVAHELGLLYDEWHANEELPGGRVTIIEEPYLDNRALHERLLRENAADGNRLVDMLFCVPPSYVSHSEDRADSRSIAASRFAAWGYKVWDGASEDVRESYPLDVDQLRIIQYDSCRGLEGWISVNLALDQLYDLKVAIGSQFISDHEIDAGFHEANYAASARRYAARFALIPLTRAMDTLVIHLSGGQSPLRTAMQKAAALCSDYVEWL